MIIKTKLRIKPKFLHNIILVFYKSYLFLQIKIVGVFMVVVYFTKIIYIEYVTYENDNIIFFFHITQIPIIIFSLL